MYIWTKRQLVGEMTRLVDGRRTPGAVLIGHAHNQRVVEPIARPAAAARGLPRSVRRRSSPVCSPKRRCSRMSWPGGPLDLSRRDSKEALDQDPALTIIATRHPGVFARHALEQPESARGEFRVNPLYTVEPDGDRVRLRLQFPGSDYEEEYGACRRYSPRKPRSAAASWTRCRPLGCRVHWRIWRAAA